MSKVEVLINDEPLVLDNAGDIVGTFAINKLGDIASRQGNYTNTFKAPVTNSRNKEIAGSAQQINSQTTVPYVRQTAEIKVGGAQTVLGVGQLRSVKDFFEWVIKSGNADLFERIKGLTLRDLDLSAYDHLYNNSVVYASRAPGNTYTFGYVYPDIDYGYFNNQSFDFLREIRFMMAFYCKIIFDKIISEAGFTWSGDFSTNTLFPKMIIPFAGSDYLHTQAWVTSKMFKANMTDSGSLVAGGATATYQAGSDNDSTAGFFDNGGQWTLGAWNLSTVVALAYFTANEGMRATFTANINFTVSAWTNGVSYLVIGLGGISGATYTHTDSDGAGTFDVIISGEIDTSNTFNTNIVIQIRNVTAQFNSGDIYNTVSAEIIPDSTVQVSEILPDIKQSDFLLTIFNQFGLFLQTNNLTNNINIFHLVDVINNISNARDWRGKVDLSERADKRFLFEDYAQENFLEYETDDEDILLSTDPTYGRGVITVANEFLNVSSVIFKRVFAPVKRHSTSVFDSNVSKELAAIPKYVYDSVANTFTNEIDAAIRIAYVEIGNTDNLLQIAGEVDRATSPAVFFTDLEFENLIDDYYEPLERLLNKAKVVTALVRLTVSDINQLDFEKPVLFTVDGEDGVFYLNEVKQFKFNKKESTEVELILLRP